MHGVKITVAYDSGRYTLTNERGESLSVTALALAEIASYVDVESEGMEYELRKEIAELEATQ